VTEASPRSAPKRKPSHLKAAGKLLSKEARRIVGKHRGRLGDEMADRIEAVRARVDQRLGEKNWIKLEERCEELDELLHKHASFARKGALRETAENVGLAVLVALALRSCLYEPFKIPSPSMVPTLVPEDHIFVNKFRYGVQIPFTTKIVAMDMVSEVERGEVVVFRYPLDEKLDYIKRVVGLPGDTVKVKDEQIWIKRPGAEDFERVPRERLDTPCPDNFGEGTVDNCVLFRETLDEHDYLVKIDRRAPGATRGRTRVLTVPEGHLMVMGDNRRHSADSLQWTRRVEAVFADKLVTDKDLRDLTDGRIFRDERSQSYTTEANQDEVTYIAERNSGRHDMRLQVWRNPGLGVRATFAAASEGLEPTSIEDILAQDPGRLSKGTQARLRDAAQRFRGLAVSSDDERHVAAIRVAGAEPDAEVIAKLSCGLEVCPSRGELARELLSLADALDADEQRPARELLRRPGGFTYTPLSRVTSTSAFIFPAKRMILNRFSGCALGDRRAKERSSLRRHTERLSDRGACCLNRNSSGTKASKRGTERPW
jgi:signal peptidase I